ncbi:ATP-binding protein [Candidatus Bipolaricaulota bacterium]
MTELKVFVSSVQKELEDERLIVQNLIQTDPFLQRHCLPILYELEPASPDDALEECLELVTECQIYILIVWKEYGAPINGLSITHWEYRRAKENGIPILAFIRGSANLKREAATGSLLAELKKDNFKRKRFSNVIDLQKEIRAALAKLLEKRFSVAPTSDEDEIADNTIEATSTFESQHLKHVPVTELDLDVGRELILSTKDESEPDALSERDILSALALRGLLIRDPEHSEHFSTAAGLVFLGRDPSAVLPHCRVSADAYRGKELDGDPSDQEDIRGPMPSVVEKVVAFIDRNTRHPMRVVGLNRVRLDEYPTEAIREAVVNALAHRNYEDGGRRIMVEVFSDRVVISSPGNPPNPITLAKLRKGTYKPCSRNPVIAQCLSYFHRIEERGSGFRRMRDAMLDHGLERPKLGTNTGYFQVTLGGPGDDLDRLRVPAAVAGQLISPSIEAELTDRQREMVKMLANGEELTSKRCQEVFSVSRPSLAKDFGRLIALGIAEKQGQGRATRYILAAGGIVKES